ncbi:MAG: hypothetical protein Q8Q14_00665 [Gemmatimonadales bacterium]|nr:hypothetical protein [Gemmatimonadales bacterium]
MKGTPTRRTPRTAGVLAAMAGLTGPAMLDDDPPAGVDGDRGHSAKLRLGAHDGEAARKRERSRARAKAARKARKAGRR